MVIITRVHNFTHEVRGEKEGGQCIIVLSSISAGNIFL